MRRLSKVLTAVLVLLAGAAALPAAAANPSPGLVPGLPAYLALGDSIAAGQQSATPAVDFPTTAALWKASGYAAQFQNVLREDLDCLPARSASAADGCRQLQMLNLARTAIPGGPGGVTTAVMLQEGDQLDQAVALLRDRNGDRSPRDDVEVITLTVGGNDVFGPAIAACLTPTAACVPTLNATFQGFVSRYGQILAELRAAAGPETVIMTMTYDNPLPFCALGAANPAGASVLGTFVLEGGNIGLGPMPLGFNDWIRAVSAEHGAVVAETFGLLGAGDFVGGADCLHPDLEGHQKIAGAFAERFPG